MAQAFSLSLKYLPLRTGSLDHAREFYEKLLGLPVSGVILDGHDGDALAGHVW
jgi:catechol-2,3-dioxygenase